jgi:hypothetical protein
MKSYWPFWVYIPLAIFLLLFGVWLEFPGWLIAVMVAVPLAFGAILTVLARRKHDSASTDKYQISSTGGRATGHLELPVPQPEIEAVFRAAVAELPRLELRACSTAGAELDASANWKTWGLLVTATFEPVDHRRTRITVSTRPRRASNVIDHGQSRTDVSELFDALERQVAESQHQS